MSKGNIFFYEKSLAKAKKELTETRKDINRLQTRTRDKKKKQKEIEEDIQFIESVLDKLKKQVP